MVESGRREVEGRLVPLHLPRPLRDPLRGLELGCLHTRAMTYGAFGYPLWGTN